MDEYVKYCNDVKSKLEMNGDAIEKFIKSDQYIRVREYIDQIDGLLNEKSLSLAKISDAIDRTQEHFEDDYLIAMQSAQHAMEIDEELLNELNDKIILLNSLN